MALSFLNDRLMGGISILAMGGAGFAVSTGGATAAFFAVLFLLLLVGFFAGGRFTVERLGFLLVCASTVPVYTAITASNKHNLMIRFFIVPYYLNII
jgi:hypothetical protein